MAGRGPSPKAEPVRRNARSSAVMLPAEGRQGETPAWPLPDDVMLTARLEVLRSEQAQLELLLDQGPDPKEANRLRHRLGQNVEKIAVAEAMVQGSKRAELELWEELWRLPHAVAWERMRWTREVAQYARWKAKAELGDMDASKEARMLADRLGLTPKAMQDLRWQIVSDEVGTARQSRSGARGRIKAV
jgi:hypothetical protein